MKESMSRKAFLVFNNLILALLVVVCIYPMLYVLFASFSDPIKLMSNNRFILAPLGFQTEGYRLVFNNDRIILGYLNTIIICIGSIVYGVGLTILGAYFFSRKDVMHQRVLMLFVIFSMFFGGGIIPTFLLYKDIGLTDNLLSVIIAGSVSTTNLIIMRTAFLSLPGELEDAAKIDGTGHITYLIKIVIPLSMATISVIILYVLVGQWNSWFNASIFLQDKKLHPLQLVLREILVLNQTGAMDAAAKDAEKELISETIKYAVIVVATVPILCIYPFIQKYFVKGVMIGAVKG